MGKLIATNGLSYNMTQSDDFKEFVAHVAYRKEEKVPSVSAIKSKMTDVY